ncbi:UNVERIFIED_CONTAM: hypothetical protein RMT77_006983 [Armadillidium vulgare]
MERCQTLFLAFGICIFITVIYLLSSSKRIGRSPPLEEQIIMKDEKIYHTQQRANFILILTDDQDVVLGSAEEMEFVKKYIKNVGTEFKNSFVASPLCCPSRSSIFSGQYVHNHKTFNNSINGGCSSIIWQVMFFSSCCLDVLHLSYFST